MELQIDFLIYALFNILNLHKTKKNNIFLVVVYEPSEKATSVRQISTTLVTQKL